MRSRRGQAALIIVLVVLVALTVVVAIASQSVTTVSVSTQEEERSRSFSAAEAGVEDALRKGLSTLVGAAIPTIAVGSSSVGYQVTKLSQFTADVNPGETLTLDWLTSAATRVDLTWVGVGCTPTLVYTTLTTGAGVTHQVDATSPGQMTKGATDRMVRMSFAGCTTTVTMNGTLAGSPALIAVYQVDATGVNGEAKSRVQVARPELAGVGIMDVAVFSGGDIQ